MDCIRTWFVLVTLDRNKDRDVKISVNDKNGIEVNGESGVYTYISTRVQSQIVMYRLIVNYLLR